MAQLKDTVVQGSLRVTDTLYTTIAQLSILNAPTSSNGTAYGPGTADYVLMSNGTSVYWGTGITNALKALDVSTVGNTNGSKYIAAISQADGKISATAIDVATTYSSTGTTAISGTGVAAAIGTLDVSSVGGDTSYISAISESDGKISATSKSIQSTYSSTGTLAINGTGVAAALATLDSTLPSGSAASKTLTALTITDGKMASATFSDIAIGAGQITSGTLGVARGGTGNATGTATYATTTQETAAALYPIGVTSAANTALKRDTSITMTGGAISAASLSLTGTLGVTGATTLSSTLSVSSAATLSSTLTVGGTSTFNGTLVGKNDFNYGTTLPGSGTLGRIFFQISPNEYELPAGGAQGQALIKASNSDRDVTWGPVGGIMQPDTTTKYYVTGSSSNVQNTNPAIFDTAIYVQSHVLYGAAWNDYAEYREANIEEPGRVIIEQGNDTLQISTERLQLGAEIISDTYGFAIGETIKAKTPIATSGRVLAYPYEDREIFRQNIGKPVCSGPSGTVSIMTQEEYEKYGYCAIGTISAVPDYEEWGEKKVKVNGRVWIRVK